MCISVCLEWIGNHYWWQTQGIQQDTESCSVKWIVRECERAQFPFCVKILLSLLWRHDGRDGVSNHQPRDCLLNRPFMRRSKKTPKLRVTGLCARNSPVTGEFPAQMPSNAETVSLWWRHHMQSIDPHLLQYWQVGRLILEYQIDLPTWDNRQNF